MAEAYAGIVLCGGQSSRMGSAKALLPFGPELMLQRMVRLVRQVARPILVVAARRQELPPLGDDATIVRDRRENRGPLEGLAVGLTALPAGTVAAYVTSCDVPLLRPAFARRMIELHRGYDIAVPFTDGFHHPLSAVYSATVLPNAERLLADDRLSLVRLIQEVRTRKVFEDELRDVDPDLASLRNLNHLGEYQAALAEAGFAPS